MSSLAAQVLGYVWLTTAAGAMAVGAAGLFSHRLRSVVIYSAVLQAGYIFLGLSAGLLAGQAGAFVAAVFQAIAAAAGIGLMWASSLAIGAEAGDELPLREDAAPPAWCVFCLTVACMSLVGLPPLAGLPARVAIIHAGLRNPGALFLVTIGAAVLGVVSLWVYAGILLPMIRGRVTVEHRPVSLRMRIAVDAMIGVLIGLGVAPYIGFAIGAAVVGAP